MAKRFTDTSKWQDDWFLSLSNDYRIVWQFLLDNCTIAGRWKNNLRPLNFYCNTNLTREDFETVFKDRVFYIEKGDFYFIPKFLKHQYPTGLISHKPMIVSVMKEIEEFNLSSIITESLGNDYPIIKVRVRVMDKVKDKGELGGDTGGNFDEFWKLYPRKVGKEAARKSFKKVFTPQRFEKMKTSIELAKKSAQWQKEGGQFIPHPATWLNQGRWDDEHEIKTNPAGSIIDQAIREWGNNGA